MQAIFANMGVLSRSVSYLLGSLVVALAAGVWMTAHSAESILTWLEKTLGATFCGLLVLLAFVCLICLVKLLRSKSAEQVWLEAGLQAASGIATLALTFTLLGISLGIGSLASQTLTPETVQEVIRGLTEKFSLAFFTTVIGLPVSTIFRSLLLVTHAVKATSGAQNP